MSPSLFRPPHTHTLTQSHTHTHTHTHTLTNPPTTTTGESCLVSEKAIIGVLTSATDQDPTFLISGGGSVAPGPGVRLGRGVVVETRAVVEAEVVGEGTVVEVGGRVGKGARVGRVSFVIGRVLLFCWGGRGWVGFEGVCGGWESGWEGWCADANSVLWGGSIARFAPCARSSRGR